MEKSKHLDNQTIKLVLEAINDGKTLMETAKMFDISYHRVRYVFMRGTSERKITSGLAQSKVDRELMSEMVREGKTFRQISQYFGVSRERVRQIATKLGIKSSWYKN